MSGGGDLVAVHGDRAVTNSLSVADRFGKQHKDVSRAISNFEASDDFNRRDFAPGHYLGANGQRRPLIEPTRDGAMFPSMGFTGPKAARWKERFSAAFNEAERRLEVAVAGRVDVVAPFLDAQGHIVILQGRGLPADLVDASAINALGTRKGDRLLDWLAAPFGIAVGVVSDAGPAFPTFAIEQGKRPGGRWNGPAACAA